MAPCQVSDPAGIDSQESGWVASGTSGGGTGGGAAAKSSRASGARTRGVSYAHGLLFSPRCKNSSFVINQSG